MSAIYMGYPRRCDSCIKYFYFIQEFDRSRARIEARYDWKEIEAQASIRTYMVVIRSK